MGSELTPLSSQYGMLPGSMDLLGEWTLTADILILF